MNEKKSYPRSRSNLSENALEKYFTTNPSDFILKRPSDSTNVDNYINKIDDYIREKGKNISTSQLRNIFSEIRKFNKEDIPKLKLFRVKLAYISGRNEKSPETQNLCLLLDSLIKNVNENNLEIFKDFFEAIISYHKFYNPKGK